MPRFQVYANATVKQGLRYTVAAPTPEEAVRRVMEEGEYDPIDDVKVIDEECVSQTLDWVWDNEGNDVTRAAIIGSG